MDELKNIKIPQGNGVLPCISGSDSKECKNCLYHNAVKVSCKHPNWDKCIVRDDDDFVIDYLYHEYHYR